MIDYIDLFTKTYKNYASYFLNTLKNPFPENGVNFFYFVIFISLLVWILELINPWRKYQKAFRKDFFLDTFYMFFNFFLFNLLLYTALSSVTVQFLNDALKPLGYEGGNLIDLSKLHWAWQLFLFFIIADFIQWCVHVMLHRVPFLWNIHKVHHSVKEMGFAAHMRYHFGETLVYNSVKYISLSMLFGFELHLAFIVYTSAVAIGHLNHANIGWDYGPLKYIFNNPKMHIWHHAKELPKSHPYGMNYGISLSIWDYLFKTNYIPYDGRDIELGFEDDEHYAKGFFQQLIAPFRKTKKPKH
ncbi:sterol desaturase family protein [Brumimicrobium aurantiacum]|uniref:Sterol desaturase family protein n=1 Tax=Brumimicrobium aurantiacum TaxID=1737063 RepID=A0A3E1EY79_9FLAO|nr:sterol desaturase family protein [Brumimicrobium aurantiacum]RFC54506.1 sterol desaturase family protein [Brumimicrobium aurantiacum]